MLGQPWRADVTRWGAIAPWDGSPSLDWHVAADDRWHSPRTEEAVRQRRLVGHTDLRDPDARARRRCRAPGVVGRRRRRVDGGGGRQRLPAAVRLRLHPGRHRHQPDAGGCSDRGHRAPSRFGRATRRSPRVGDGRSAPSRGAGRTAPARVPSPPPTRSRAAGWRAPNGPAGWCCPMSGSSRLLVAARCDLLLGGLPGPAEDPVAFLLAAGELVRLGEIDRTSAGQHRAGRGRGSGTGRPSATAGTSTPRSTAAALVLARAEERRGVADLVRIAGARSPGRPPVEPVAGVQGGRRGRTAPRSRPDAPSRRHPGGMARRRARGARSRRRAGDDAVVRRALARRPPGRAVAGHRRAVELRAPGGRPDVATPTPPPARPSGGRPARRSPVASAT